jgi:hypothetical protein
MPYTHRYHNRETKIKDEYNSKLCHGCKQVLTTKPSLILPCGHHEHVKCLKVRLQSTIDKFDRDSLGWHSMYFWDGGYCLFPGCYKYIKHLCDLNDENCFFCYSEKEYNVKKVNMINDACVGKKLVGFRYRGEQWRRNGLLEFVTESNSVDNKDVHSSSSR